MPRQGRRAGAPCSSTQDVRHADCPSSGRTQHDFGRAADRAALRSCERLSSVRLVGSGEGPRLDRLHEVTYRAGDIRRTRHEVAHEARLLAWKYVEHVVQHQYLAGTIGAGADSDRWNP